MVHFSFMMLLTPILFFSMTTPRCLSRCDDA